MEQKLSSVSSNLSTVLDDAVLPVTRWLAIFIIPFLVAAAVLLYIWPNNTDQTFAWTIKPSMTPMMLAAAYIGGIVFFGHVAIARQWHTIRVGFLPVIAFASLLGVATILHWDRFNHSHISFFTWTALYFTAPFLVLAVWLLNRSRDTGQSESHDPLIGQFARLTIGAMGAVTLFISMFLFFSPTVMIDLWPWTLTPLTARVVGAMFALPGLVGMGVATDSRWSAAKIILQSQSLSIVMILVAALRAWADFKPDNIGTYLFVGGLIAMLLTIVGFYFSMEMRRFHSLNSPPSRPHWPAA
jgi:glucose uptake protein GlcU